MNTAEIVVREVQRNGGFQVRQLLTEGVRQSRKSADRHSHGEVLPLHVASRNVAHARIAYSHLGYNLRDSWWGVPPFVVLPKVSEQFHELREVHVQSEDFRDGLRVEVKPVRGQLDLLRQPFMQIANEPHGIRDAALSDAVGRDQFCVRVLCDENPLVAHFRTIVFANAALLLAHEAPNLITLYIAAIQVLQSRVQQSLASLANCFKQPHNRVSVEAREPFCAANRAAFKKAMNRTLCRFGLRQHRVASQPDVGFAKGGIAGNAAPALNPTLPKVSSAFAIGVLASVAGHGLSPLDFCGKKPHTHFGSGVRLTPRFGLALPTADTGDRAVSRYSSTHGGLCIAGLLSRTGPWILCSLAPTNHGPFAGFPAKSFLLREKRVQPAVSSCIAPAKAGIACLFQFSGLFHSPHGRMDRGHIILVVSTEIKAHFYKHRTHSFGGKDCIGLVYSGTSNHGTDRISKTQGFTARLVCNERGEGGNCLNQLSFPLCESSLFALNLGQLKAGLLQGAHKFVCHDSKDKLGDK